MLAAGAALIAGFSILNGIDPFDEGLMLQAARRIVSGQLPYRDFLWAYGPAQPYLQAALFRLMGVSLLQWRVEWVAACAGISVVAWLAVRDRAPGWVAITVWLAVACEISEPRSADPSAPALLAVMAALALATTGGARARGAVPTAASPSMTATPGAARAAAAGLLVALAAAFRIDFAAYGLAAVTLALAAAGPRVRRRTLPALWGVALAGSALVYLPFAIADGPVNLYRALIGNSLATRAYWTLPFPLAFHAPPGAGLAKTAKKALDFYVPLLAIIGCALLVATAIGGRVQSASGRPARIGEPARELGLAVLALGFLAYFTSRADANHAQPLVVVVATGLGLLAGTARVRAPAVLLLALLALHGVANRLSAALHPPAAASLRLAVADGVQAPPAEARAIERMVALVDANSTPRQPIYVLARRSDMVVFSDPLIYVLTERDNPTAQDFGLLSGAAAQARIVAVLARVRPRVLVRWTDPLSDTPEPNLRGRPSGVHTLDDWVAAHYRVLARLYHYTVLVER